MRLFSEEFFQSPYATYRALLEDHPIVWVDSSRAWFLSRYDDVRDGLRDRRLRSGGRRLTKALDSLPADLRQASASFAAMMQKMAIFQDGAVHDAVRAVLEPFFDARGIARIEAQVRAAVRAALAPLSRGGEMDFLNEVARPLPAFVIGEMIGVAPEDRTRFARMADDIGELFGTIAPQPEIMYKAGASFHEMLEYFRRVLKTASEQSLAGALRAECSGDDAAIQLIMLMFAGQETTRGGLVNSAYTLLRHERQWDRLTQRADLLDSLVDECLRYESPVQIMSRVASEELELCGQPIRKDDVIMLCIGAANRDARRFAEPDVFDVGRDPNPHLAFGAGSRYCPGASLARLEIKETIRALTALRPRLHLAGDDVKWGLSVNFRCVDALRLRID